jgi:quercetin dioxygenase-like cupin family protein
MLKGNLKNMKFKLVEQINYQDGAVVSKEVLKNTSGTVTLFAFDQGQGLSEHKTPFEALVQIVDGEAEVTINGQVNILKTGEMIYMPAKVIHALKASQRFKMLLIMLKI